MKYIFFLFPSFLLGQLTEVVQVDLKQSQLYNNTIAWFGKNSNEVVQNKDHESGLVSGKIRLNSTIKTMGVPADGASFTTLTVNLKDGKYKYEFSNIYFRYSNGVIYTYEEQPTMARKPWEKWKASVDSELNELAKSLKSDIAKSGEW